MFGPSFGQPSSYNYFPGNNGDYNTWGAQQINNSAAASAGQSRKTPPYDDYYRENNAYPISGGHEGGGAGGIKVKFNFVFIVHIKII